MHGTTRMTRMHGTTRMQRPLGGEGEIKTSCRKKTGDPIWDCDLTASTVKHDLILMENQIPFFVLEKLFRLTVDRIQNSRNRKFSLDDYVFQYFGMMMSPEENSTSSGGATAPTSCGSPGDSTVLRISLDDQMKSSEEDGVLTSNAQRYYNHILHKLHDYYLPQDQTKKKNGSEDGSEEEDRKIMPCASELEYAGVKFEPVRGKDLFKVEFSDPFRWFPKASFKIPFLEIYDNTELFLSNLIAFEQCCPGVSKHFTSYALLMDTLVNSDNDVSVLEKAGVIHNYLGARAEATNLFNSLCKEVVLDLKTEFVFADMCSKATEYSKRDRPKYLASVERTYFGSPRTFIAFVVAFLAFAIQIVTFVQSFL
ncbi:hypothetical protein RHMOL_Rhmol05G0294400 [Rhododendron molle]|uniref:Uncharacterized protein n=2 Tax=Rhododendron molle TaxID=49168 RepID=A0ACC0NVC5_RHOML|nr:hypothetical protein RHMOL_Rhmol05G0294000 [Rhododendron molle]KAI8556923.1 hypothetical protein RHMOL_Rhmol05G0294400 [Rhododendron molle]